jgi:hypothetical protein
MINGRGPLREIAVFYWLSVRTSLSLSMDGGRQNNVTNDAPNNDLITVKCCTCIKPLLLSDW